MTIPLQPAIVYWSVMSRSPEVSLEINLLPCTYKLCSFNCIYCQFGPTTLKTMKVKGYDRLFPPPELIYRMVENSLVALQEIGAPIDCIMFSGNGEPTLHPKLGQIIDLVRQLQRRYYPNTKLSILSNSSLVLQPAVQKALNKLDERIMKMDAGHEKLVRYINLPCRQFNLAEVIVGLKTLKDVTLQSMFFTGSLDNTSPDAIAPWLVSIDSIKPRLVQIHTLDVPPTDHSLRPVDKNHLLEIAEHVREVTGVEAHVF